MSHGQDTATRDLHAICTRFLIDDRRDCRTCRLLSVCNLTLDDAETFNLRCRSYAQREADRCAANQWNSLPLKYQRIQGTTEGTAGNSTESDTPRLDAITSRSCRLKLCKCAGKNRLSIAMFLSRQYLQCASRDNVFLSRFCSSILFFPFHPVLNDDLPVSPVRFRRTYDFVRSNCVSIDVYRLVYRLKGPFLLVDL